VTVYLFLPNLIGYARIVLALVGYAVALKDHQTMLLCYMGSQFLDAIDGLAARMLGQSSQFGAVLDMVTDRASTACLCIVLGALYPQYVAGFCSLIMLDLFSHWYHTYAALAAGKGTHKGSSNWLVNVYYNRKVLFTVCAGTELWYVSLYMMHFTSGPMLTLGGTTIGLWRAASYACTPLFAFKQLTNIVQLYMACEALVEDDEKKRKEA
jgi:CDP-diacylglycerol--inositol 3-phosphatidyltransferase